MVKGTLWPKQHVVLFVFCFVVFVCVVCVVFCCVYLFGLTSLGLTWLIGLIGLIRLENKNIIKQMQLADKFFRKSDVVHIVIKGTPGSKIMRFFVYCVLFCVCFLLFVCVYLVG